MRSLVAKLPDIEADQDLQSANVLCFCETWLSPAEPSQVIKADHVVLRGDGASSDHKGGVMLSAPNSYHPGNTVTLMANSIESIMTTLHINCKTLLVGVV